MWMAGEFVALRSDRTETELAASVDVLDGGDSLALVIDGPDWTDLVSVRIRGSRVYAGH
jgi:hypothetical protein